jgi:hypothetical protein
MRTLKAARLSGPRCGRRNGCEPLHCHRSHADASPRRAEHRFVRAAFAETLRFVNEANTFRPRLRTRIVLNRRDAHDLDAHEIAQALAKCDPPVLTSCIGRRAVLAEAVVTGRLAFEMAHSAAAVRKNCARGRSRKDGVMTTHDLKRTSMAHGCESDTSMHQPRANVSINVANAERCIGEPTIDTLPVLRGADQDRSLERTIAAAEAPCGRSTNSLTTVPEGAA